MISPNITHFPQQVGGMMIFASNSGKRQACNITLEGLSVGSNGASLHRIDSTNGNPVGLWTKWGSPAFPTPKQVGLLMQESENKAVRLSNEGLQCSPALLAGGMGTEVSCTVE